MKRIVLTLLLLAACLAPQAQIGTPFGVNMFITASSGINFHTSEANGSSGLGFAGGIGVGKWILEPLAGRVNLDLMSIPAVQDHSKLTGAASATVEFLWDFTSTFGHVHPWRVNVYPIIGLGIIYRSPYTINGITYGTDREVQSLLGVNVPVSLGAGWDLYFEYRCMFLPETFNFSHGPNFMHSAVVGVNQNFTDSPYTRRSQYESRSTSEDWFLGFGIGPNYSAFDLFDNDHLGGLSMLGVAPEIMFGRNFSNFWTIRFELTGLTGHEAYDTIKEEPGKGYSFSMLHADVMMNLSHALDFKRGRKWSIMPYLGAGAIWRYDHLMFDMAADFGIMLRRYVSQVGDFYVDLKYLMVAPRIGGGMGPANDLFGVGLPSLTVGYIHNFGMSSTRYRQPVDANPHSCFN